ncbi:MAG: STAS domain-containing protein [Solirubrobacteraceae bacterium]
MPGDALAVHESDVDGVRLLEVFGELDLATAPKLCALLDAARIHRVKRLVVDLTGVDFCDSTGLRALIGASTEIRIGGGRLAVACLPGGAVARLFEMVGARESLGVFDSAPEALASVTRLAT